MATKTQLNDTLKQVSSSFGFVKASGKKIASKKGIKAGSIGPLTATDAYRQRNRETANQISHKLENELGLVLMEKSDNEMVFEKVLSKKKNKRFTLHLEQYRTYWGQYPDYYTFWWVVQ